MDKAISIVIELLLLGGGLYLFITTIGEMAGYYTIGEGSTWVQLFFLVMLILNIIFYALIRISMETKQKLLLLIPAAIYFLIMLIGPGAWLSEPFFQGFLTIGGVGLLFIALPILILLTLRYLFLKFLVHKK